MKTGNYNINYVRKRNNFLKYLFLLSAALVAFYVISPYFNKERANELSESKSKQIGYASMKEIGLSLSNPVLEGLSKDNLPYKIIANLVMRSYDNVYDMTQIDAHHSLRDGLLSIKSKSGAFNETTKLFNLLGAVMISFNDLILTGEKIDLDLHSNLLSSKKPITVAFKDSTVRASTLDVDHSNKIIKFHGGVLATFNLDDF